MGMGMMVMTTTTMAISTPPTPRSIAFRCLLSLPLPLPQAQVHNQHVVMPLVNYWKAFGGMETYVQWSPTAFERDDFYTDANCRAMFKNHLYAIVNRVNTYTNQRSVGEASYMDGWIDRWMDGY